MSNELTYGFIDLENKLVGSAIILENDTQTIERIKNEIYQAHAAYPIDVTKVLLYPGQTYWNGTRFLNPSPFPSWSFDNDLNAWVAPTPVPFEEGNWIWNEKSLSWVLDEQE